MAAGRYSEAQRALVHDLAELARAELIEVQAWPLDEGWETWRPPEEWDEPLSLPASLALPS